MSPVTMAGRALVSGLGWLSVIAFGAITVLTAQTWTDVIEDVFRRTRLEFLSRPSYASVLWGLMSISWIALMSRRALDWWRERVPDYEVTVADSYWFAYITTLTVGLGDYFLQPQGFYLIDVFRWAYRFLTGFVVVSTFLGKIADLVSSMFPQKGESLADHLARTDCRGNDTGLDVQQSKAVKTLQELVDDQQNENVAMSIVGDEDDSLALGADGRPVNSQRTETLLQKRHLVLQLLERTESELEERIAKYHVYRERSADNVDTAINWNLSDLSYQEGVLEMASQHTVEMKQAAEESEGGMKSP